MTGALGDARLAVRAMLKYPAFAVAGIVALALGSGATTATYGAIDALLVRPLPYPDGEQLVLVWQTDPAVGATNVRVDLPDFKEFRGNSSAFSGMAAFDVQDKDLTGRGLPERLRVARVSANWLDVL